MLVLEVRLAMVTDDPVSVGRWWCLRVAGAQLALVHVVKTLVQTLAQVHVTDGVDALGELHGAGQLSVSVAPVVLDTLHVPLVHNNDNFLALAAIDLFKEFLVLLVNEDLLDLWEEAGGCCDVPVHLVLVHALLTESSWSNHVKLQLIIVVFLDVKGTSPLESLGKVVDN